LTELVFVALCCNSNVPDIGCAPALALVTFGRDDSSSSACGRNNRLIVGACVLEVALPAEVFNIGPFIRVDAARHTLLQYSGLAILVSIAKVTTWKDNRIFNLIAGDNPIDTRCFARAGFFVKVDRTRPDDLDSATKA
jgi:hypothetical protein